MEVLLRFRLNEAHTRWGESIRVVGECEGLGKWAPEQAVGLTTDGPSYPTWISQQVILNMQPQTFRNDGSIKHAFHIRYKYVKDCSTTGQGFVWEPFLLDREVIIPVVDGKKAVWEISDTWGQEDVGVLFGPEQTPAQHQAMDKGKGFHRADSNASCSTTAGSEFDQEEMSENRKGQQIRHAASAPTVRRREMASYSPSPSLPEESGEISWPDEVLTLLPSKEADQVRLHQSDKPRQGGGCLELCLGVAKVPHRSKQESGGEDAVMLCPARRCAALADGVGEWSWTYGVNPVTFAEELVQSAVAAGHLTVNDMTLPAKERAARMLAEAYEQTYSWGSSTALIAALDPSGRSLGVANLGDSGLRIFREPGFFPGVELLHRTQEQQHEFNRPFQLTRLPTAADLAYLREKNLKALEKVVALAHKLKLDSPSDAQLYDFSVKEGDIVVLGSDGVFDNLHDGELIDLVSRAHFPVGKPLEDRVSALAAAISRAAVCRSQDNEADTPFSKQARQAGFVNQKGGKEDDVSVVVAVLVRAPSRGGRVGRLEEVLRARDMDLEDPPWPDTPEPPALKRRRHRGGRKSRTRRG